MKALLKKILSTIITVIKNTIIYRMVKKLFSSVLLSVLTIITLLLASNQGYLYYNMYIDMYNEANEKKDAEEKNLEEQNLEFTKIDDNLYTLTGGVGEGDCDRISRLMPQNFTLIMESPGGNLSEGSCLAAHIKLRNVVTVVRDTPVLNADGKIIYTPGLVAEEYMKGKTMCASACALMFLGGDKRYLIGEVWYGIHGPGTPAGAIDNLNRRQLESSSFRTASNLLELLVDLGVDDPELRLLFIKIPNSSMYWLKPQDFELKEGLRKIATNYKNFWGYNNVDLEGGL